jgi:hypothetical protein
MVAASLLAFGAPRYYDAEYHPCNRGALYNKNKSES